MQSASASIALLPLIQRKVKVYDIQGADIEYSQRPVPTADKDFSKLAQYFPTMKAGNSEVMPSVQPVNSGKIKKKKQRKAWVITLDDIVANGQHKFWVYQLQGELQGKVNLDLSFQTKGGAFSASNGQVDILLDTLLINGDQEILKQSRIKGTVEIAPVIFSQNKGIKSLAFITLDTELSAKVGSLDFLDLYLQAFKGMNLDGKGLLNGRLRFDKGRILPDTHLTIDSPKLSLTMLEHTIEGNGVINLDVNSQTTDELAIEIEFDDLLAYREEKQQILFSGNGLSVMAKGSPALFPLKSRGALITFLGAEIPSVKISNLEVYQQYIPEKWGFKLYHGEGELQAKAALTKNDFNADLKITSTDADVGIKDHRFSTDLDFGLAVNVPSFKSASINISGTYIRFDNSKLSAEKGKQSKSWQTALQIEKGTLKLHLPEMAQQGGDIRNLSEALKQQKLKDLLAISDAELIIKGTISQLEWLNFLLKNKLNLAFSGAGQLSADVRLLSGWPATGSQLEVKSKELGVSILDYQFLGDGILNLEVEKGGANPDIKADLQVIDALFKRQDEEQAFIQDVVLKVDASVNNMSYKGPGKDLELHMQIPSARVKDMSVYNLYFPKQSLVQFSEGEAELTADIHLKPESAKGFIKLKTEDLKIQLDEQQLSAELKVDIKLADGIPSKMNFDISGSSILLDKVRIIGEHENFDQTDWSAKVQLIKAQTTWRKPISIHTETKVVIKDTRPLVAILSNQREKHGWLSKLLTIEDIQGTANINIEQGEIVIPYAFFSSDKVDLGAKGIINEENNNGVFYVRFKKLKGLLKIENGKRNFDIIGVKKQFDEYSPIVVE